MTIEYPAGSRKISAGATDCPTCGQPLDRAATVVGPALRKGLSPPVATSFLLSVLAGPLKFGGYFAVFIALLGFATHVPSAPIFFAVGVLLVVGGTCAKYVSGHARSSRG